MVILDRDLIYQKYIVENYSIPKLSKELSVSEKVIFNNISEYGIKKDKSIWIKQLSTNLNKVVLQYDLEGKLVKEWNSLSEVKKIYGGSVASCCRGETKTSHGYIWRYKENPIEIKLDNLRYSNSRKVKKYNLDGYLLSEYSSIKEASLSGFNDNNIQDCCVGRLQSHGGFIWRYSDDPPPSKYSKKSVRKVVQYSISGEFIKEWNSIAEASKELGIGSNCITTCCKGKYKSSGGFIWRYLE